MNRFTVNMAYASIRLLFTVHAIVLLSIFSPFANADIGVEPVGREKTEFDLKELLSPLPTTTEKPATNSGRDRKSGDGDPDDPCLPSLYTNWGEFSDEMEDYRRSNRIIGARISIDPSNYQIFLEAILENGSTKEIIRQNAAVGDRKTPTPQGFFFINHIYCYPDVLFFGEDSTPVRGLYGGFFAPLLLCDEKRNCKRFNNLGIHGFQAAYHPNQAAIVPSTFGPVSAGCVRLSDPCAFKMELIRIVGLGSLRKNDRGYYHWLKMPVQVVVRGNGIIDADQTTIVSMLENSMATVGEEFSNMLKWLYQ